MRRGSQSLSSAFAAAVMSGGPTNPTEAEQWLHIAERYLQAGDLISCKRVAVRAIQSDPLVRGVDQILAVAEVHLAAKNNSKINWYSILQLDPAAADSVAVKRQYRRLELLLLPANNKFPGADAAFKLVVEAHTILSDLDKKSLFDAELEIATARTRSINTLVRSAAPVAGGGGNGGNSTFWSACSFSFYAYQYRRVYRNRDLLFPTCQQTFRAVETAVPPPIVLGTDMYYSAWGFYPLGFPGGPAATSAVDPRGWQPFHSASLYRRNWNQPDQAAAAILQLLAGSGMHASEGNPQGPPQPYGGNVNVVQQQAPSPPAMQQPIRKKRVRGGGEQTNQAQATDGEVSISGGAKENAISGMHVNATDEIPPFSKRKI